ncbi:MAG: hypothetical protein ACRDOB_13935 [Streptosporangiaceae bacterium]
MALWFVGAQRRALLRDELLLEDVARSPLAQPAPLASYPLNV